MAQPQQIMQQQLQQPQNFYMNQMSASPQAQLYVGDLEEEITEETLYQKFSKFGPIFTLKIMRDSQTKKSRGFAFIQYQVQMHALEAIAKANHTQIINNRIRVALRKNIKEVINNDANVYIKNIDEGVSEKALEDSLKKFGKILSSKISLGKKQQSLGYGYVQFEKKEEADKCIKEGQNLKIGNKTIQVFKFESKKNRVDTKNNLYIKNLPKGLSEAELQDLIKKKFTEIVQEEAKKEQQQEDTSTVITSILVKIDPKAKLPFAFVCFEKHQFASKIYDVCNDKDIFENGQNLYINWFQTKHEREKVLNSVAYKQPANETNLFTKNLVSTVTKEQLKEQFKIFGEITSCDVKQPPVPAKQQAQGEGANADQKYTQTLQGFINFANKEAAKEALIKAKDNNNIKALYVLNKVFLNYHIKKDQYQKFQQSKKRQEHMQQQRQFNPFDVKNQGNNARAQQMFNAQFMQQMQQLYQLMPMLMRMPPMMPPNFFGMPQGGHPFQMPPPFMNYGNLPQRGPQQMNMMGPAAGPHHNMQQQRGGQQVQQQGGIAKQGYQNIRPNKKRMPQGNRKQGMGGGHQGGMMNYHHPPHQNQQQMPFGGQNLGGGAQNLPQSQQQQQQQQAQPTQQANQENIVPFTPQTLKSRLDEFQKLDKERQRLQLGEMIFPMVKRIVSTMTPDEQVAPKVTGMLIDFDVFEVTDILEFLEDENVLNGRIKEAIELINETQNQSSQQTN